MSANFSRVPGSVRACGRHLSHPDCPSKKRKTAWNFPRKCSPGEKKKQMHGRAGTERGAPANTRALDDPKTAADRKHERSQACRQQLHGGHGGTLVSRGRLLEFSPSTLRRSGAGGREGALVSARCKGCSYDAECSANYTADVHTLLCANHRSLRKK